MIVVVELPGDVHGPRGFIVEGATPADVQRWQGLAVSAPEEWVEFAHARIHLTAGEPRRCAIRAGSIRGIRQVQP